MSRSFPPMTSEKIAELRRLSLAELMRRALETKLAQRGDAVSLCTIINAKSGNCGEDCRFCVQSAHYRTNAPVYGLKSREEVLAAAREAREIGASHFSIVASGRGMNRADTEKVAAMIEEIGSKVGIRVCASLGIMDREKLEILRDAGLVRYHHNLETSREFFPQIVTTHSFEERLDTIGAAQEAGLEVCAGGIMGLGETEDDRISMAMSLRECGVDSVPLNILIPLPGTPLAGTPPITAPEVLRTIALYRLLLPQVPIRLAAGRDEPFFRDFLGTSFMAGADGLMIGGYLTKGCRPAPEDRAFVRAVQALWNG